MSQVLDSTSRRVYPKNAFTEFAREDVEQSIVARFEKQVLLHRDRIAVKTARHEVSYDAFNRLANRIAHAIPHTSGAVGLLLDHDAPLIAAIIAVLKAARFYVPLDLNNPIERLRTVVEHSEANLIITEAKHLERAREIASVQGSVLNIDALGDGHSEENLALEIAPSALAYLIYTSGSTGKPKGVCQTHRNVLHNTRKYTNGCHLSADDRFSLLARCSFGASVSNIFGALLNGGTLLPFRLKEEGITALRDWLREEKITIYHSVPIVFRNLSEVVSEGNRFRHLRLIKLGGEAITRGDFELYKRSFAQDALLYVGLGSTEMNCVRYWLLDGESNFSGAVVPVGYEAEDTDVLLLDESQREVAVGDIGEIAIRSNYLFPGYWRQPELDKSAFIADPSGSNIPVFRTHDLGRMLPGGLLQHLGRNEFQIKIRGARVEAAEVELALRELPEITDCAVVTRDRGEEKELVAYLTNGKVTRLDTSALRSRLAAKLPDYMIPANFVWLDRLPRINGKIDRKALPALLPAERNPRNDYVAPRNKLETELAKIWQDVLGYKRIGVHDNFFDLGGHSLAAARVAVAIDRLLDCKLPVSTLFWAPTIEALARHLTPQELTPANRSLVELKPGGSRLPLFIMHGWGGDVHFYGELARLLPEQPVYGLQAVGLDGKVPRHIRVQDMAAHYLKEIRTVQPHGPYHLIGFSLGALIAFEVAQQVYEGRECVEFLGLLDPPTRPAPWIAYARTIAPLLAQSARYHLTRWLRTGESFHLRRRMKRLRRWLKRNWARQAALVTPPDRSSTPPEIPGFRDYYKAVSYGYQLRRYPGSIDVLVGNSVPSALLPLWQHLAKGGARYYHITCTHKEMIQREFLPTLAATLNTALAKARSKSPASG